MIGDLYPSNPKFYENLRKNLVENYVAFYGREPENDELKIKVVSSKPVRVQVKNTFHRASLMLFEAEGVRSCWRLDIRQGLVNATAWGLGW